MKERLLTVAALAWMAVAVTAQDNTLSIDAQLRIRGEHDNGVTTQHKHLEQAANFITERARLSFAFQRQDLELKASLQHTGLWGDDDIQQTNNRTSLVEAWAKMRFAKNFFAQVGRMQLAYDDERILGAADWNDNGNWHNALRMGYEGFNHRFHFIFAMNQEKANNHGDYYDGPMEYKNMTALWYHFQPDMLPLGVSLTALNIGLERGEKGHGRTNYMQTVGTDITFKPMQWNVHAAFYYQMGKTSWRPVNSWMAAGSVAYTFSPKLTLSAGYDYLSGNDPNKDKWNAFYLLYGTNHKFFGAMDYFTNNLSVGLQDIQAGVSSKITDWLRLNLNYHYLTTVQEVAKYGKSLGHEIDAQVTINLMKDVTLSGGYSTMLGTETMDYVKGGTHNDWQDWAWIQLNINPRMLFNAKK